MLIIAIFHFIYDNSWRRLKIDINAWLTLTDTAYSYRVTESERRDASVATSVATMGNPPLFCRLLAMQ